MRMRLVEKPREQVITHIIVGAITVWPVALTAKASTVILAMGGDFLSAEHSVPQVRPAASRVEKLLRLKCQHANKWFFIACSGIN